MTDIQNIKSRPGVRVHAQAVIANIHETYGRTIGQLVQENAELTSALAATQDERDELQAKWNAMTGGDSEDLGRPADAATAPAPDQT